MSTHFTTPDRILKEKIGGKEITINQKLTPDFAVSDKDQCSYVPKGGYVKENEPLNNGTGKPKGITVHNTPEIEAEAGTNMAEQYQRATYPNCNMRGVAVHYWVWHDVIWQQLRDDEQGWHASDGSTPSKDHRGNMSNGNMDTISIECIGPDRESEETLILLVACLCRRHGLEPKLDVYTHNYWMHGGDRFFENVGKNCPLYILPHWDRFLSEVSEALDADKKEEKQPKTTGLPGRTRQNTVLPAKPTDRKGRNRHMILSTTLNLFILDHNSGMQPYIDEIRNYKQLGFDSLDCIFCDGTKADSPLRRPDWLDWGKHIAEASRKIGITYHQCHMPYYNFANDGRKEDLDELCRRSILIAKELGATWTVTHPATDFSLPSPRDSMQKNHDYFAPFIELGEKNGIGIAIENMADFKEPPFLPWYCARVEELIELADSFRTPYAGICWDFGHGHLVYEDACPCLREIGARLKCVHVHDNWGDDDHHLPVFFGNIRWEPLMHTLQEIGYEGVFDFEVKRIPWTLPLYMRNAQWQYVKTTGDYLLSLIGQS